MAALFYEGTRVPNRFFLMQFSWFRRITEWNWGRRMPFKRGGRLLPEKIEGMNQDDAAKIKAASGLPVLRAALQKVIKANRVMIKVSPYDLDLVQQSMSESALGPDWLREEIKIEADFEIARGGCKVLTDSGEIDATIETQLHLMKSILWNP